MSRLEGRTAVITGANQGLGEAIAAAYVSAGADVLLCARDADKLVAVRDRLRLEHPVRVVEMMVCDVSREPAVDALRDASIERLGRVDVLVNNAGVYGPLGAIEDVDWEAWKDAIAINLLGSVYASRAFVPHFRANGYGKIVQLSGGGATQPLPRISAYAASKAAVVRFAETLAEELRDAHVDVNCIAPGALNTRLLDDVLEAGPAVVGPAFYERSVQQHETGGAGLDAGAALAVYLGSAASDGITGKLISALWDPWADFDRFRAALDGSDVFTLRRIVPQDRPGVWPADG